MKRLEPFTFIDPKDIPPCSSLIHYGKNEITRKYGIWRWKFPYYDCPMHASFALGNGLERTVGPYITAQGLKKSFTEKARVDVITYTELTEEQKNMMLYDAYANLDRPKIIKLPTYGFTDFLRAEPWLRWIPASKKRICSEDVARLFLGAGFKVCHKEDLDQAYPWDLLLWAMEWKNSLKVQLRTTYIGSKYK